MKKIKNVVILGGGTAGWLAAYILSDFFNSNKLDGKVKIIESSKIPTIGVGEGTTSIFYEFLKKYKLDEADFLKETKATLKFGIVHKDWKELGNTYYGPIDDPQLIAPKNKPETFEYLKAYAIAAGRPVSEIHLHTLLMQNKKVPYTYKNNNLELISPFYYAYHFDNSLVANYLKKRSKNIEIIDDIYTSSSQNDDGTIKSLHFESGLELGVDLVIDCSGFKKLIVITGKGKGSKIYGDPYISEKMGVLKNSVPDFIMQDFDLKNIISSLSKAKISDGGDGAIYVNLKKL